MGLLVSVFPMYSYVFTPTPLMASTTVKLLPQVPSLKPFTGEDASYSALHYLKRCQDLMRNSNITSGADQVSYVQLTLSWILHPNSVKKIM